MKNIIVSIIIASALLGTAFLLNKGLEDTKESFELYGYEGVLYRLNTVTGRLDVLVPSNEAALLFPVGQIQLPRPDAQLTDEQKASFASNIKTLSQYIQSERARSLALEGEGRSGVS